MVRQHLIRTAAQASVAEVPHGLCGHGPNTFDKIVVKLYFNGTLGYLLDQ